MSGSTARSLPSPSRKDRPRTMPQPTRLPRAAGRVSACVSACVIACVVACVVVAAAAVAAAQPAADRIVAPDWSLETADGGSDSVARYRATAPF